MLSQAMIPLIVAQAVIERGLLDAMAAAFAAARYRVEVYVGEGNSLYLLVGLLVVLALVFRRRR